MKSFAAVLLATMLLFPAHVLAQAAAPAPASTPAPADGVVQATLANGMRVILLPNKLAPVATTMVSYGVGSIDDSMPGIAHATEHMLFRGTPGVSAGQLADIAARMGAQYNAFTATEYTLYYFKLPSAYVDLALHIESDRMTHASIKAADWNSERGPIEQEILARQSTPGYKIGQKISQVFFKGTPLADLSPGTVASFTKMTSADIRAFYEKWYQPSNATIIVAGDIDPQATLASIHRLFDPIAAHAVPAHAIITVPMLTSSSIQETMDFPVGFGVLMYRMPGTNDADYAASSVMISALANGRGAFADLTVSGKTLAAIPISSAFPEVGVASILAIPNAGSTPQNAQSLLSGVLATYRKDGIPADQIDAAKLYLLSERAYRQDSISGLGFAWAEAIAEHRPTPDVIFGEIDKVRADDVNRVLRAYLNADHQLAAIILGKPSSTTPKTNASAGVEDVSFTPSENEKLPLWAALAFKAPLRAPKESSKTVSVRLPNGIHVSIRRETTSPTVVVSGVIRTDSTLYEPKGKDGISLIMNALFPFGTKTYERKTYQTQLESIAASASLGPSFSLRVQSKYLDRGLELLADGLLHPAFAPGDFATIQSQVLQSVGISNRLPRTKADLAERYALYGPGDPRRRDVTETTVRAIALSDVQKYYTFAFRPDETTIAIVGDVTPAQAQRIVEKVFGSWKALGAPPTFRYPHIAEVANKAQTVTVKSATSVQSEVTLKERFKMRRTDADYVPLLLANTILSGEGTGSMLFKNLRSHYSYVYSVDSDVSVGSDGGEFDITYATSPKNVNRANAAAIAIIKRLQHEPLPVVELQRAKALLLAQRVLPLDSYNGLADAMLAGVDKGYDNTGSQQWFWDALVATTPQQVRHAMQRIDADHFLRVIVAPGD